MFVPTNRSEKRTHVRKTRKRPAITKMQRETYLKSTLWRIESANDIIQHRKLFKLHRLTLLWLVSLVQLYYPHLQSSECLCIKCVRCNFEVFVSAMFLIVSNFINWTINQLAVQAITEQQKVDFVSRNPVGIAV